MNPATTNYAPIPEDKINVCMAFLTYVGENLTYDKYSEEEKREVEKTIHKEIHKIIPKIPTLVKEDSADWKIVWGPAIFRYRDDRKQDSGMFVIQQISNPSNYVLAIRGTNYDAWEDWFKEDFEVLCMKKWSRASGAKISKATNNGIELLLNLKNAIPAPPESKSNQSITEFLTSISTKPITISFTGHSLGGALAPTLALWFRERQGEFKGWDPKNNAVISCTAFAGATAGNATFANYSNIQFRDNPIRRIHDTNDVVPHAWNKQSMGQIAHLYSNTEMQIGFSLKLLLWLAILLTKHNNYTQIGNSIPITLGVDGKCDRNTFKKQATYQHDYSYPLIILGQDAGNNLWDLISPLEKASCG